MRPIDAVVDATNYVMLELGQPLHGFDLDRLVGPGIVVRRAHEGERLTTLDDVERSLTTDDLLICDLERAVAIAGVMGGQTSEVSPETRHVLLESAFFTRGGVLLTARRLDLHSEASHRFERGTDPEGVGVGAARGAKLIAEWAGGEVLAGVAEAGTTSTRPWVSVRPARASHLLGYEVDAEDVAAVFDELGYAHRQEDGRVAVEVPGHRPDIEEEVDLIEEVVRIQGYDRVGSSVPRSAHAGGVPPAYAFARHAKDVLLGAGLRELRPAPFASSEDLALFGDEDAVPVANPLRAEEGFLRTRLTPGLLRAAARNRALGVGRIALFEVGLTFRLGDGDTPFTEHRKAGFVLGGTRGSAWGDDRGDLDVLDAKGVLETFFHGVGVTGWELGEIPPGPFHPGRSASVRVGDHSVGVLGEIHPRVADELGLEGRVAVAVVGLGSLEAVTEGTAFTFEDPPRFPPVRRDLAFVLPTDVPAGRVEAAIRQAGGELLDGLVLFDVFQGAPLADGTRSLGFAIGLRASDRTLTDEEAQTVVDRVAATVAELGGQLRTG
jgi:phenylalanyl-tRNA synthetase beta chain